MQILLAVDDVTQTKELEHKMTDAVSVAAHQLRTPLTGIKWAIDEYRKSEEGGVSKEDRKALFDTLYEATVRMFNVIQGLLDVSKLEQGKVEVKPEPVQLDTFIDNALKDFAHPVTEKKLSVKQTVLHTLPEASYDVILLRQVIQNLIDNAIKYTPVGGEIASILSLEKERIHWTLHDSGIGITKADLEHLFEKFHRGDNAQRLDAYGMGLGLYAVKSIMDLLGGEIRCESEEGHGTTFHLFFPLKKA
jgi:two-component system phosphate regulon sensor histidine kinase PhoR